MYSGYLYRDCDRSKVPSRYFRTTDPTTAPITLAQAKAHLRLDGDDEDDFVQVLIDVATQMFDGTGKARDGILGCAMMTQTWTLETERWVLPFRRPLNRLASDYRIWIEHGPVQSVESIQAYAGDVLVDWPQENWRVGYEDTRAFVTLASGGSWPTYDFREDAFQVAFTAGYGDNATDVPAPLRAAMLLMIGHLFENRQSVIVSASRAVAIEVPQTIETLIAPYKVQQF
jgi:uncharacterized phiE125 gp8 family phage protein